MDKERGGKKTSGNGQAWSSASSEGSGEQGKMEKTGCKIICGAPTSLAVKGLMMRRSYVFYQNTFNLKGKKAMRIK